jgi:hypothetical protein
MPLKAGGVTFMAAKRPLLAGSASVAAGGPAANRCSETASTIWFAAKSTIRLKCFKKSAPKMAKLTFAKRKVHYNGGLRIPPPASSRPSKGLPPH